MAHDKIHSASTFVVTIGDMHLSFTNLFDAQLLLHAIESATGMTGESDWDGRYITLTAWNGHPNNPDTIGMIVKQLSLKD